MAQKVTKYLGSLCNEICWLHRLKVAQSGHTERESVFHFTFELIKFLMHAWSFCVSSTS